MDNIDIKSCAEILALCDSRLELLLKYIKDMSTIIHALTGDLSDVHQALNDMIEE